VFWLGTPGRARKAPANAVDLGRFHGQSSSLPTQTGAVPSRVLVGQSYDITEDVDEEDLQLCKGDKLVETNSFLIMNGKLLIVDGATHRVRTRATQLYFKLPTIALRTGLELPCGGGAFCG
jgi:hypothetical protein